MVLNQAPDGAPPKNRIQRLESSLCSDPVTAREGLPHEVAALKRLGAWYLTHLDPHWPENLSQEIVLRGQGRLPACGIAIVGARNADAYGLELARRIAQTVADRGLAVISGGALGVDGAAHRACLDSGGKTVVVLGSGLNHPAPRSHHAVFCDARQSGAVVSPFPCHQKPARWTYPKRNPIIAALAEAVVVVQASAHSGSLQTARVGLAQGKPVWVVPGNMDNPLHEGCHILAREGAQVLSSPDAWADQLSDGGGLSGDTRCSKMEQRSSSKLWLAATGEPESINVLARRAGMEVTQAMGEATTLELDGWLRGHYGGRFTRSRPTRT